MVYRDPGTKNVYNLSTLPKFNITPEKLPPEKQTSLPTTIVQGPCWTSGV